MNKKNLKKILLVLEIALGLIQTTQAQVGCDMMNLIVNVGSVTNMGITCTTFEAVRY